LAEAKEAKKGRPSGPYLKNREWHIQAKDCLIYSQFLLELPFFQR
jgi:hypothetical protein